MKSKNEIIVNKNGLEIEVELVWAEEVKEWVMDSYNAAKCIVYQDATELLPYADEVEQIVKLIPTLEEYVKSSNS